MAMAVTSAFPLYLWFPLCLSVCISVLQTWPMSVSVPPDSNAEFPKVMCFNVTKISVDVTSDSLLMDNSTGINGLYWTPIPGIYIRIGGHWPFSQYFNFHYIHSNCCIHNA